MTNERTPRQGAPSLSSIENRFRQQNSSYPPDFAMVISAYVRHGGQGWRQRSHASAWLYRCPLLCGWNGDGLHRWNWDGRTQVDAAVWMASRPNGDFRLTCMNGCRPSRILDAFGVVGVVDDIERHAPRAWSRFDAREAHTLAGAR